MKYYTYKITFPGTPYFYWGYHKHSSKEYWGSPTTRRWVWDYYEPEKQILEWFGTREEAVAAELRLIKPYLNDPYCLNEGCGPGFSLEVCSRAGKIGGKVTAQINLAKGNEYWEDLSRTGVEARLQHMEENPEFWSAVGRNAANKRWEDPSQKEVNARACRETGRKNKGRKWANNGSQEKYLAPHDPLPAGYEYGRLYKPRKPAKLDTVKPHP